MGVDMIMKAVFINSLFLKNKPGTSQINELYLPCHHHYYFCVYKGRSHKLGFITADSLLFS